MSPSAAPRARSLRIAALALLPMLVLSACGGDDDDDNGSSSRTPGDTYAITTDNRLISFDRAVPELSRTRVAISGLAAGETLVVIDIRPSDGQLYGLVNNAAGAARVVTINPGTGATTALFGLVANTADASDPYTALQGTNFGIDFNPVPDALRIISDTGQNLRVALSAAGSNPAGATTTDAPLTISSATATGITAAAYTNAFSDACRTTLYYLDTVSGNLLTTSSPNDGVLTSVGSLGRAPGSESAFEISTATNGSNAAFAALDIDGQSVLLSVDLSTAATTSLGAIDGLSAGELVRGIAMAPPSSTPTQSVGELYGLTEGNRLISFNRGSPAKLCTRISLSGLNLGEIASGLDFRPSTGQIYALGNASGTARLLTIDPVTGATSGMGLSQSLVGTEFGMDFNPTGPVALRIVSDSGQNLRVTDIGTGATTADSALNGAADGATAAAYTNSVQGAGTTTLYVIDPVTDSLMIQSPPNNGVLTLVGELGVDITAVNGFDIDGRDNVALVAVSTGSNTTSTLHTLNLATGALSASLGTVGGSERLRGLTRPTPLTTVFAVDTDNQLVTLSLTAPGTVTPIGPIAPLQASETVLGLDFRPSTGLLYALGDSGRLYTVDPATGATSSPTLLSADAADNVDGNPAYTGLLGTEFGVDFNPMPASVPLRIVSDAEQNLRVSNPPTGATFTDANLARAATTFAISGTAYTNSSFPAPTTTVLYGLDSAGDRLVAITPPNNGITRVIGATGVDVTASAVMDIAGPSTALAVLDAVTAKTLYTVNLATGAATQVSATPIAASGEIRGIAAPLSATDPAAGSTVFVVDSTPALVQFARNAPGSATTTAITGLGAGETVRGIDFRADATGALHLFTVDAANSGRIYTVNTSTGVATLVSTLVADAADTSAAYTTVTAGSDIDFNPLPATVPLRIVNGTQNLRVANVATGATFTDTDVGQPTPDVFAAAYTNSFTPNPSSTALYVLDAANGSLLQQVPPNNGTLVTIGALSAGSIYSTLGEFDIAGGDNGVALAALRLVVATVPEAQSRLYRVNLVTGVATEVVPGTPIGGSPVRGLAIRIR